MPRRRPRSTSDNSSTSCRAGSPSAAAHPLLCGLEPLTASAFITLCALNPQAPGKPSRLPCVRPPTRQCRTGASSASPMRSSSVRAACWLRSIPWGRTVLAVQCVPFGVEGHHARTSTARREPAASLLNRYSGHGSGPRRPAFAFVGPSPAAKHGCARHRGPFTRSVDRDGKPMARKIEARRL